MRWGRIVVVRGAAGYHPRWVAEDRPLRVWRHYPDGLFGAPPYRVWTAAVRGALNARFRLPPMTRLTPLAKLRAPLGAQEIELQQIDFDGGGMSLLRTRIREGSRFTVFDIDPVTARQWGEALLSWAQAQPRE
jgi:hypothetical protein